MSITILKGGTIMILSDAVRSLIVKMDVFMTKQGTDVQVRNELIDIINSISGKNSLDAIFVNETDNFHIPDVVVMPLYHNAFNAFLLNADDANTCPFGYTVEIHKRCFSEFTAEELTALVIHDIMQNVQSDSAKIRFIKAYTNVIGRYPVDEVLDLFDDISSSEVLYMAFADICTRPFHVPVIEFDYLGTDEVLRSMGLAEAYESYLDKSQYETKRWVNRDSSNASPEAKIEAETKNDYRTMKTIIAACMDKDIRHYYTMVRNAMPLVCLGHVFGSSSSLTGLGFVSRSRRKPSPSSTPVMTESVICPKTELELRFQVDKIITEIRYMESEAEREIILYKIKTTSLKLHKMLADLQKRFEHNPADKAMRRRIEYIQKLLEELEKLRASTVNMNVKQKRYGVFISWPKGYEDSGPILDDSLYQL